MNNQWLKPKEYLEHTLVQDLTIEEETHINHRSCPAGTDRKKRLYVKLTEEGYIAYCHHCNKKGFSKSNEYRVKSLRTELSGGTPVESMSHLRIKESLLLSHTAFPINMSSLLQSAGISNEVAGKYGIAYDTVSNRMDLAIFPACTQSWNEDNPVDAIYQQKRALDPKEKVKYTNVDKRADTTDKPVWEHCSKVHSGTVIVVEDILSGIRIAEAGHNVIALLGTTMTNKVLVDIINKYTHIIIWLDGDKAGVKAAIDIHRRCNNYIKSSVIQTNQDPKTYTDAKINKEIAMRLMK